MADITLSTRAIIRPYRSKKGSPAIRSFQESTAASTSLIEEGRIVTFGAATAAHRIILASSAGGRLLLGNNVVGVAARRSTSDGSTTGLANSLNRQIEVWLADPDTEFIGPSVNVTASTDVGKTAAVIWDSTNDIHLLDSTNSTAAACRAYITEVVNPGDTNGLYVFKFHSTTVSPAVGNA